MKPRLQVSLGQQLVMTPQLQQAIRLLQLSNPELDAEIAAAVESNPLLDWVESGTAGAQSQASATGNGREDARESNPREADALAGADRTDPDEHWHGDGDVGDGDPWPLRNGTSSFGIDAIDRAAAEQIAEADTLHDHLLWQLHLSHLSPHDRLIGVAVIEAIDDDGYLRDDLATIAASLAPDLHADVDATLAVLHHVQRFDPAGVGARDLGECLRLQLTLLPDDNADKALARALTDGPLQRLPRVGIEGLAKQLGRAPADIEAAVRLLRSLDPRPGARVGAMPTDTYVVPDVVIGRHHGVWRVALATGTSPRIGIHRGYERMIAHAGDADAGYLRGCLQEARWLLKSIQARGDTLLKVMACVLRQQSAFLEFGDRALRPLTLREVAAEVGLHESTVSRAIARKYARTPRGTIALRDFFASGIVTGRGGETSSTAIQAMLRRLIEAEDPRKPLSDARLAAALKADGVPVARRTVAKYREAMGIASSQDRVRMG